MLRRARWLGVWMIAVAFARSMGDQIAGLLASSATRMRGMVPSWAAGPRSQPTIWKGGRDANQMAVPGGGRRTREPLSPAWPGLVTGEGSVWRAARQLKSPKSERVRLTLAPRLP